MNALVVIWALVTLFSLLVMMLCAGAMVGMRICCKIWASSESYEGLYGPGGTCEPGWFVAWLYRVMRSKK